MTYRGPQPEVPKTFLRLQSLPPHKAFVAGALLTDLQGPALGSLAIAAAGVGLRGRLASLAVYTLLASGIRVTAFLVKDRSVRVHQRLERATAWVMRHRRSLASWGTLGAGVLLVGQGLLEMSGIP